MQKWKNGIDAGGQRANAIEKNASILPGGDGSRKSRNCKTIAAYGWGVYGIRGHLVEYWANKHNSQMFKTDISLAYDKACSSSLKTQEATQTLRVARWRHNGMFPRTAKRMDCLRKHMHSEESKFR